MFRGVSAEQHGDPGVTVNLDDLWGHLLHDTRRMLLPRSFRRYLNSVLFGGMTVEGLSTVNSGSPPPRTTSSRFEDPWPLPPPHPDAWAQPVAGPDAARSAVNMIITLLGWEHLGRPEVAPTRARRGARLSDAQLKIAEHVQKAVEVWGARGAFHSSELGRTACKMENVSATLHDLQRSASLLRAALDPYGTHAVPSSEQTCDEYTDRDPGTKVIGHSSAPCLEVARDLVADRIRLKGVPTFDPSPLYDSDTRAAYACPCVLDHGVPVRDVPFARVRGSHEELLKLYRKLDSSERLALVPVSEANVDRLCGMFAVAKDSEFDRLVIDARPANAYEHPIAVWTYTMASASLLCNMQLSERDVLAVYSDDLTDYYYEFVVSDLRAKRNVLRGVWPVEAFAGFRALEGVPEGTTHVYASIATMAMGDSLAVELGQNAHLALALRAHAVHVDELVLLQGRPPRSRYWGGVIQDDHGGLQMEAAAGFDDAGSPVPATDPP